MLASTSAAPSPGSSCRAMPPIRSLPRHDNCATPRFDNCAVLGIPLAPNPSACRPGPPAGTAPHIMLQHPPDPRERGFERRLVMDDRETDILATRIGAAVRGTRGVAARQHAHRRVAPQAQRRLLAVADIEPQKEPAL